MLSIPEQQSSPILPAFEKVFAKTKFQSKIQGFGASDIEQAKAYQKHLEHKERLSELEHCERTLSVLEELENQKQLAYHARIASSSSESSNFNTLPASLAPGPSKTKRNLKRTLTK
jgi:hypothetical protein